MRKLDVIDLKRNENNLINKVSSLQSLSLPPINSNSQRISQAKVNSNPQLSQRTIVQSSPYRRYQKFHPTFSKPQFLYLDDSKQQCTFQPQIKEVQQSSVVSFYENKLRVKSNKCNYDDFLSWKGQYDIIEADQWIVQYLFPNLLGSQGDIDADIFRNSAVLAKKIINSYELMLDFYGFTLMSDISGDLILSHNHRQRHEDTFHKKLAKSVHAYRIKRILQFLSKTGFLNYCQKFIAFISVLIYGDPDAKDTLESPIKKRIHIPPLAHLSDIFESEWKKFGELDLCNEMQQKHLKNVAVFFRSEKYAQSAYFQEFQIEKEQNQQEPEKD